MISIKAGEKRDRLTRSSLHADVQLLVELKRNFRVDHQLLLLVLTSDGEPAEELAQEHLLLLNGEPLTHAVARPGAERNVGESGPRRPPLRGKPLGVELVRLLPHVRVPVDVVDVHGQVRVGGNHPAVDDALLVRPPPYEHVGRVQPHRLPDDHVQVPELAQVFPRDVTMQVSPEHLVQLRVQKLLLLRVARQHVDGPGEDGGGGAVAGEHERVHFFLDVLDAQPPGVLRADQQVQKRLSLLVPP